MNIITGYTGVPHITSAQDRAENQGTFGTGSYILNVGLKMAAEIISATEVRIKDGVLSHQGCLGIIESGMYDALTIANGSQGMKRLDLIVCRYEKNSETNIESLSLVVIQGTATSGTPTDPSYNTGSIQGGDSPVDFPLYRVNINGVSISSITQVAENIKTQAETDTLIGNTAMGTTATTITGAIKEHETDISILNGKTTESITLSSNVTASSSFSCICEKRGNSVTAYIAFTATADIASGATVATIPSGFRPPRQFRTIAYKTGGYGTLEFKTSGAINTIGAISNTNTVLGIVSYIL